MIESPPTNFRSEIISLVRLTGLTKDEVPLYSTDPRIVIVMGLTITGTLGGSVGIDVGSAPKVALLLFIGLGFDG